MSELLQDAQAALRRQGIAWTALRDRCQQIIAFGSRARGTHTATSDIDLLCVGGGWAIKSRHLEVVVISIRDLARPTWLGGLLANEIKRDGIWLHGSDTWSHRAFLCDFTIHQSRQILRVLQHQLRSRHAEIRAAAAVKIEKVTRQMEGLVRRLAEERVDTPAPTGCSARSSRS